METLKNFWIQGNLSGYFGLQNFPELGFSLELAHNLSTVCPESRKDLCKKCKMVCKCFLILFGQSRVIQYCQKKTGASPTSKPKDHCNASWFHPLSKTRNLPPALFKPCPVFPFKQTSLTEEPHLLNLNLGWSLKYSKDWMMNSFESHQMALHGGVEVWQCCWTECLPSCKLLFSPRALYSLCCMGASYLHFVCAVPGPHYRNDSFR